MKLIRLTEKRGPFEKKITVQAHHIVVIEELQPNAHDCKSSILTVGYESFNVKESVGWIETLIETPEPYSANLELLGNINVLLRDSKDRAGAIEGIRKLISIYEVPNDSASPQ